MKHNQSPGQEEIREVSGQEKGHGKKRSGKNLGTVIALTSVCILLVALFAVGIHYYRLLKDPRSAFTGTSMTSVTPVTTTTAETVITTLTQATAGTDIITTPAETLSYAPVPTLSPYEQLQAQADYSLMDGIVNVLLVGVDYAPERETWSGKHDYHADVMLLLAIDFNKGTVDMISIPRDTYALIPGVDGKYKINASINCGGGMPDGLPKVCQAASWMLGGIPVDYYFAVTMPVVKELVDAIGGVEYDVDVSFQMVDRSYKKGLQFMNGQAVLDYLRVRKNVEQAGDQNRINRQKKMLITLFQACKDRNLVVKFPEIVKAFKGKLFTNMNADQVVALALFAYNLDVENIAMHSMGGVTTDIYNWAFVLTDQEARVKLIKEVYGIDVKQEVLYSRSYCLWEWANLTADAYLKSVIPLEEYAAKVLKEDAAKAAKETAKPEKTTNPEETDEPDSGARRYSADADKLLSNVQQEIYNIQLLQVYFGGHQKDLESAAMKRKAEMIQKAGELTRQLAALRNDAMKLKSIVGYAPRLNWAVKLEYEIKVDFR